MPSTVLVILTIMEACTKLPLTIQFGWTCGEAHLIELKSPNLNVACRSTTYTLQQGKVVSILKNRLQNNILRDVLVSN